MSEYRVRDLYVYPLKSAAGVRVDAAEVDALGLAGDRRWMVVDATGRSLSQRELPRMALLRAQARPGELLLEAPDMPALVVETPSAGPRGEVRVWRDRCEAVVADPDASRWLCEFLEYDCQLVYRADGGVRSVDATYARRPAWVGFADAFPMLLISQGSLDDLNARLAANGQPTVPMNRFRPNLVVEGAPAYAEDDWRQLAVGPPGSAIPLDVVKPCARCSIVPVDQATGIRGTEPLRTLATYRRRNGKVYFGQNVIHRASGTIRVGDSVRVMT
ncbi:MAG: MOSC domain-containing protein [Luteitalea sp.]|nr:MOSC domain-containing protein [Luteitalea sp.]